MYAARSHAAARLLSFVFINVAFFAIRTGFDGVKINIDDSSKATIIITRKLFTAFGGWKEIYFPPPRPTLVIDFQSVPGLRWKWKLIFLSTFSPSLPHANVEPLNTFLGRGWVFCRWFVAGASTSIPPSWLHRKTSPFICIIKRNVIRFYSLAITTFVAVPLCFA